MTDGVIAKRDLTISQMRLFLDIRDKRTIKKHLAALMALNWVGYDAESGYYFVRGFPAIRKEYGFKKRTAVTFYFEKINQVGAFVAGAIITNNLKAQKFCRERGTRGGERSAVINKGAAKQDHVPPSAEPLKPYLGIGST